MVACGKANPDVKARLLDWEAANPMSKTSEWPEWADLIGPEPAPLPPNPVRPVWSGRDRRHIQAQVWEKNGGICWYCGLKLNPWLTFSVDHFCPVRLGGSDDIENLVPCCRPCNARKRDKTIDEFRHIMSKRKGTAFTDEQVKYLNDHGVSLPELERTVFWFEADGLANGNG